MRTRCLFLLALLLCLALGAACAEPLDLTSAASMADITAAIDAAQTPENVDLTGVELTTAQRRELIAAYPATHFIWTMDLYGTTVSSEDTEVTLDYTDFVSMKKIGAVLDCMPNLKTVNLWTARVKATDWPVMMDQYPDVFFGFRLKLNASHIVRTDWTGWSTLGRQPQIAKGSCRYLGLVRGLKALDIGHMNVHSLAFLEDLPPLKILIVADNGLKDKEIKALACQTELEYLEIFKNYITDLSPLSGLTELRDLNIGYNRITDLSPLYDLPKLERLWVMGNWFLEDEEIERFKEHQPNCEVVTWSYGATGNRMDKATGDTIPGTSWRHHKHYDTIYWIFHNNEYIGWDVEVPQIKGINDK